MSSDLLAGLLVKLPESALVLDVGGWASPHPRADWVIDIGSYETRDWYETIGAAPREHAERFGPEHWVEHDICAPEPWPFEDDRFDLAICSHTLEDVRDPIKVCSELSRVAKAGYVETPAAATELTRGIESASWCGWRHHRWLVEQEGDGLVFLAKPHHIHSALWPSIRSPKLLLSRDDLRLGWTGSLPAREQFLVDSGALDARLLEIVARSSRPDRAGDVRRDALGAAWRGYRSGRAQAGRAYRAIVSSTIRRTS